jgi:carotene isomerase
VRILDDAILRDRYAVVVVGSGIGGLTAAALLAKRGLEPLVIEQHYLPGGACTTMRRRGITFDVGVAMMFGFGQKGFNPHRFVMNEIEEEIDVIAHECLYRMHILGRELTFWRDFERYFEELVSIFPHQRKELRNLYDYFYRIYEDMILKNQVVAPPTETSAKESLKNLLKNPVGMMRVLPLMFKNTESIVRKFVKDPEVIAFFNMLTCTYCYCNAEETPAVLSGALFCDNHEGGAFYPAGSPQMLSNKLEKAIEKHGGQMLYRRLVDEILIENGQAYGVRLADGTEILADRVVANATIWNLYGKLVKSRHIKPERMAWAQGFVPTFGSLVLYLGVDAEAVPEGITPISMFVEDMYHITGNDITVYVSSLDDPTLCPPGTHTMTVVQPSMVKWPRPFDPEYPSEAYQRLKQQEADKLLDQVEKHFPDLRKHIRVMEVGTPTTIERYTLKNWGAVGGPKMMIGQDMLKRLKARSEWKNLYVCGDSTVMGIGIPATTVSGVGAANLVLRDLGLEEYKPRSFPREYIRYVRGKPWTPAPDSSQPITAELAGRMARECQHCKDPPCKEACPAGIETSCFARRVEVGNFEGAARVLREVNPFSEVCGAVCPAERFCEKNCSRLDFDEKPVRIRDLHRWVCGHVSKRKGWDSWIPAQKAVKVAVVGAGPAGLTCAHYLARLGYRVDMRDKASRPGGMLNHAIPAFRLGGDVVEREIEGLTVPGMRFHGNTALGEDFTVEDLEGRYRAVFLAPGLWSGQKLKIAGAEAGEATDALAFLKDCRVSGGAKVGSQVLVIGGGSVASDAALSARHFGAAEVTLICLEGKEEMPCLESEIDQMRRSGIRIENGWGPKEFVSGSKMSFLGCTAVFDEDGRFRPVYDETKTLEVDFDQVILAVGQRTEPLLGGYLEKAFGRGDRLEVEWETMRVVGRERIFAGGDIVRGAGTVVEAVADGRRAAMGIDGLLGNEARGKDAD